MNGQSLINMDVISVHLRLIFSDQNGRHQENVTFSTCVKKQLSSPEYTSPLVFVIEIKSVPKPHVPAKIVFQIYDSFVQRISPVPFTKIFLRHGLVLLNPFPFLPFVFFLQFSNTDPSGQKCSNSIMRIKSVIKFMFQLKL